MPENPQRPNPLQPAPWIQDMIKDKPVAPVVPEVKAPVVPSSTVTPDLKTEITNIDEKAIDAEPAPVLDKAAPVVETPAAPAETVTSPLSTEVTQGTPAAVAPTIPVSPAK